MDKNKVIQVPVVSSDKPEIVGEDGTISNQPHLQDNCISLVKVVTTEVNEIQLIKYTDTKKMDVKTTCTTKTTKEKISENEICTVFEQVVQTKKGGRPIKNIKLKLVMPLTVVVL